MGCGVEGTEQAGERLPVHDIRAALRWHQSNVGTPAVRRPACKGRAAWGQRDMRRDARLGVTEIVSGEINEAFAVVNLHAERELGIHHAHTACAAATPHRLRTTMTASWCAGSAAVACPASSVGKARHRSRRRIEIDGFMAGGLACGCSTQNPRRHVGMARDADRNVEAQAQGQRHASTGKRSHPIVADAVHRDAPSRVSMIRRRVSVRPARQFAWPRLTVRMRNETPSACHRRLFAVRLAPMG